MNSAELEQTICNLLEKKTGSVPILRRINKGNSLAINYHGENEKGEWFIKIYDSNKESKMRLLEIMKQGGVPIAKPLFDEAISATKRVLCLEWVDLSPIMPDRKTAILVAKILKTLHSLPIPNDIRTYTLFDEFLYYRHKIEDMGIGFAEKNTIFDFLEEKIPQIHFSPSIVHMDFHIGNIMHSANGLVLIDYENLAISDPQRDFVYGAFFHMPNENVFWKKTIRRYYNGILPIGFWNKMKVYCYLHLLRMIICEAEKGNMSSADHLALNINSGFSITSNKPRWF